MDQVINTEYPGSGLQAAARESEVQMQMRRLQDSTQNLTKLSEELVGRLSSVIVPTTQESSAEKMVEPNHPSTPLATNLYEQVGRLQSVERMLRFILKGVEL